MKIQTVNQFEKALSEKYTPTGGYPTYFIGNDNEPMCHNCAHSNMKQIEEAIIDKDKQSLWWICEYDVNYEFTDLECSHCYKWIESAYGEDQDAPEVCPLCKAKYDAKYGPSPATRGKVSDCDQCEVLYIQGVKTHELGCPNAWRDSTRECKECGSDFTPTEQHQRFCDDQCYCIYNGLPYELEGDTEE